MRILILTTVSGGPRQWAYSLQKYCATYHKSIHIDIKHGLKDTLLSHFSFSKYDLVHTTIPILFNLSKTPVILNFRGNFKKEISCRYPFNILYYWSKLITKNYLSPSKFLNTVLGVDAKIIPNAVDVAEFTKKTSHKLSKPIKLVVVSRFDIYEKARGVIEISKILEQVPFDFICDVYGEGVFLERLKKSAKNLHFKGHSSNLKKDLASYDIFLYYSYLDNFPNAILYSMSSNVPVITNEVGAMREILPQLQNNVVTSNEEFKVYLTKLVSSQKLREESAHLAYTHIKNNFSWKIVVKKLLAYYGEVIDEN